MQICRFFVVTLALGLLAVPAFADDEKKPGSPPPPAKPPEGVKIEGNTAAEILMSVKKQGGRLQTKEDLQTAVKALERALADAAAKPEEKKEAVALKTRLLYMGSMRHKEAFEAAFEAYAAELAKTMPGTDEAAMAQGFRFAKKHMKGRDIDPAGEGDLMALAKAFPKAPMIGQLVSMYADSIQDEGKSIAFMKKAIGELGDSPVAEQLRGALINKTIMGSVMDLSGPTLDGKTFTLASQKGKVVLVDFWATWCGPCIGELPHVKKIYDEFKDKGFTVVGISLDDDRKKLEEFVKAKEMPWPQIIFAKEEDLGWSSPLAKKFGISGIPATFLVGKDGKVVARDLRGEEKLKKAVADALAK